MTKETFYQQRKETFQKDYAFFKQNHKRDEALKLVADKHGVKPGLVNAVIWSEKYLKRIKA